MNEFSYPENFVRYLGTGGARFTVIHQYRATGGIWFRYAGVNGVIDSGPGCLAQICAAYPPLDPTEIRALLLTHKHIDHSTDADIIIEAMTDGGHKRQGEILLTRDCAFEKDPVVLEHSLKKVSSIFEIQDGKVITLEGGVQIEPVRHVHHGVECFGFIFSKKGFPTWGVISDTRPLETFAKRYKKCSYISLNATMLIKRPTVDHFSLPDVAELLQTLKPKLVTLSHMGQRIVKGRPDTLAAQLSTDKTKVVAGRDGMIIDLDTLKVYAPPVKRKRKVNYKEFNE